MSASARPFQGAKKIIVIFEQREDGGLRVFSDMLPGFVLSHSDPRAVFSDVQPALECMLSEMYSMPIGVEPLTELAAELEDAGLIDRIPQPHERREYVARPRHA